MTAKSLAHDLNHCLLSICIAFLSGCATTNPYSLTIEDNLKEAPAFPGVIKYELVYSDAISETLIKPSSKQLHDALAQLGYESSKPSEAQIAIYVTATANKVETVTQQVTAKDMIGAMNPDSIRYKNVAAMSPRAQYSDLSDDDPTKPGDTIIGPSGEIMVTGDLRRRQIEDELHNITFERRVNRIELGAMEMPIPSDPKNTKIPWRVIVVSDLPLDKPAPAMLDLFEAALDQLLEQHPEPASTP